MASDSNRDPSIFQSALGRARTIDESRNLSGRAGA